MKEVAVGQSTAALEAASGTASSAGNTAVVTPAAGMKLRVSYLSYNPASQVDVGFRFGAAGAIFLLNTCPAGGIVAKDFGDFRYLDGAVDEALYLNLSGAVATHWNVFYREVV